MDIAERLKYFDEHYNLIIFGFYGVGKKIHIKTDSKKCRFCDNEKDSDKFSNDSHAIPQFLGNKQLILSDECDDCNKFFSETLEDHLDKFTKPYRVFATIKGANKVPKYKSKNKNSWVESGSDVPIKLFTVRDCGFITNETNNSCVLNFDIEPHVPAAVYKALVKIGISLITDLNELPQFATTIQWIKDAEHSRHLIKPLSLMMTFIPGIRPQKNVTACLLRCKTIGQVPYAILVLGFGNWIYQVYMPSHLEAQNEQTINYETHWFPTPFEIDCPLGKVSRRIVDLTSHSKNASTEKMVLQFNEKIEIKNC